MIRPQDYGDQFPSDLDDTAPYDPTDGFQEIDYNPQTYEQSEETVKGSDDLIAGTDIAPVTRDERSAYHGTIIEKVSDEWPESWSVMRHDGRLITAFIGERKIERRIQVGDEVTIIRGNVTDPDDEVNSQWIITGPQSMKEMQLLTLGTVIDARGAAGFIVPFSQVLEAFPVDEDFDDFTDEGADSLKIKNPINGVVQVHENGTFRIDWSVTIGSVNAGGVTSVSPTWWEAGCWQWGDLYESVGAEIVTPKLWFNRQNGFRLEWDPADCTAHVSLRSEVVDSVLNQWTQPGGERYATWTNTPRFGGDVHVGTQTGEAWVKIGGDIEPFAWVGHGRGHGRLKMKLPATGPGTSSPGQTGNTGDRWFLRSIGAADHDGDGANECVQMGWKEPGITGTARVKNCTVVGTHDCVITINGYTYSCSIPRYGCDTVRFEDGLVMDWSGHTSQDPQKPIIPTCRDNQPEIYDPCNFE